MTGLNETFGNIIHLLRYWLLSRWPLRGDVKLTLTFSNTLDAITAAGYFRRECYDLMYQPPPAIEPDADELLAMRYKFMGVDIEFATSERSLPPKYPQKYR